LLRLFLVLVKNLLKGGDCFRITCSAPALCVCAKNLTLIYMSKKLLSVLVLAVLAVSAFAFSALADVAVLTVTKVYFEKDGEEFDQEVQYSVNCYGYEFAENWWESEGAEVPEDYDPANPDKVYSYSASCPEYGCEIYENYYANYRHIEYCDLVGLIGGEYFEIENIPYKPLPVCQDAIQYHIYDGENYYVNTEEHELCVEQYGDDDGCLEYAMLLEEEDMVMHESGYPVDRICEAHFDITGSVALGDLTFTDVTPQTSDNYVAIEYVADEGIVNGYGDGTFGPDDKINRADFVKILMEAVYSDSEIDGCDPEHIFSDIIAGVYYADHVCIGANEGVVTGYDDGSFLPANNINFAEAAKVIVKGFDYDTSDYDDLEWYTEHVSYLQDNGAIPMSIGSLGDYLTRGEMAEIIYRLLEEVTNKTSKDLL
jgi:hypothetical protein